MRFAIPCAEGKLCLHFGHCELFAIVDADGTKVFARTNETPPPHEPGLLPRWLKEKKVDVVIAGGMGQRAQQFFSDFGIKLHLGAPVETPERLVELFLKGMLPAGQNTCDH